MLSADEATSTRTFSGRTASRAWLPELQAARIAAQQSDARHLDPAGGGAAPEEFHHPDEVGDKAVPETSLEPSNLVRVREDRRPRWFAHLYGGIAELMRMQGIMWNIEIRCDIYFVVIVALIKRFRVMRSAVMGLT